jgi:hypothetical protein
MYGLPACFGYSKLIARFSCSLERSATIRHDGASDHRKVDTEEAFHSKNQYGARVVSESFENGVRTPLLGMEYRQAQAGQRASLGDTDVGNDYARRVR